MTKRLFAFCVAAAFALPLGASAQESGFKLDLNAIENIENDACRLYFLSTNGTETALERVEYELAFLFKAESGVPPAILRVKFGAFPSGKTRLSAIPIDKAACENISRIVINDSSACVDETGADSGVCIQGLSASSQTAIQFGI